MGIYEQAIALAADLSNIGLGGYCDYTFETWGSDLCAITANCGGVTLYRGTDVECLAFLNGLRTAASFFTGY